MRKEDIQSFVETFADTSPWNYVKEEDALLPELVGMQLMERPLLCFGSAADPLFRELLKPEAVGPQLLLPEQWLPGAKTVISLFFPKSQAVREANYAPGSEMPPEWLHGRVEGQNFIGKAMEALAEFVRGQGYQAVVPAADPRFTATKSTGVYPGSEDRHFTSNWSERHAAYVCGLGTFSLSKGLITEKGLAGRFGSLITDWECAPTERSYTGLYDNCVRCGACARRCPAGAIDPEKGKDLAVCCCHVDKSRVKYAPRYGCGKCQTTVPCEHANPARKKA